MYFASVDSMNLSLMHGLILVVSQRILAKFNLTKIQLWTFFFLRFTIREKALISEGYN